MKTIYSKVSNLFVLLLVLAVSACQNDDLGSDLNGELVEKDVALSFSYAGIVTIGEDGTRAAQPLTNEEQAIKKGVLLQFDAAGNLIKKYGFGLTTPSNVRLFVPQQRSLECVFIANASLADMGLDGSGTITKAELNTLAKTFSSEAELQDIATNGLMMSAKAELQAGASTVNFILKPNVAKLVFSVTNGTGESPNGGAYVNISKIQVKNVHKRVLFAHHAADRAITSHYGAENESQIIEVFDEVAPLPDTDNPYVRYIPHNMSGFLTAENVDKKFATHMFITHATGTENLEMNPGNRNGVIRDYSVEAGNSYKLNVSAANKPTEPEGGGATTPTITEKAFGSANSYIVNPPTTSAEGETVFSFPITRVTEYWEGVERNQNIMDEYTSWQAEVIWQDINARTIIFCDSEGKNTTEILDGTGEDGKIYFKLVSDGVSVNHGNILVGLKKKGDGYEQYLWSWHLWITDYNPNEVITDYDWNEKKVNGGAVHRYTGDIWDNAYSEKYIMDRNLGAISAKPGGPWKETGGMYYQFGRKDPFPGDETTIDVKVYGIDGRSDVKYTKSTGNRTVGGVDKNFVDNIVWATGPVTINEAVNKPYFYYATGTDWISVNANNFRPWNNTKDDGLTKSIYDPCPEGWKIPKSGTWAGFEVINGTIITGTGVTFNINNIDNINVYYPLTGSRESSNAVVGGTGIATLGYTNAWTEDVEYKESVYEGLYFRVEVQGSTINTVNGAFTQTHDRVYAHPVRCIKE